MHSSKRRKAMERSHKNKTIVLGFLERGGHVRTEVVENREGPTLQRKVLYHVEEGSTIMTDELHSYCGLEAS
jgi:hypothetical protein